MWVTATGASKAPPPYLMDQAERLLPLVDDFEFMTGEERSNLLLDAKALVRGRDRALVLHALARHLRDMHGFERSLFLEAIFEIRDEVNRAYALAGAAKVAGYMTTKERESLFTQVFAVSGAVQLSYLLVLIAPQLGSMNSDHRHCYFSIAMGIMENSKSFRTDVIAAINRGMNNLSVPDRERVQSTMPVRYLLVEGCAGIGIDLLLHWFDDSLA